MPAFTAAAGYIVAEYLGGVVLAAAIGSAGIAFVTSVIAVGLALATARLLGLTGGGAGGTAQDPGVRIQLPPATNNKVPVVYGHANTKGVITDARISNSNKTMTYVIVLSEVTQTGTFSIGNIYWNDQQLVFKTDAGSEHIVGSSIDQNGLGTSNTNFDGLIRIRVYSGNVNSGSQIFPPQATTNTVNARTTLDESDTNYVMNNLVFAVIQIDYNSSKGITGLGQMTFEVTNSLKNPASVWYDYMTSPRYGANIPTSQINTSTSISTANTMSLYNWSETIPPNQYLADGVTTSTQVRYELNGVISAGENVKNNIEKISVGCNCWTSFDYNRGQWKIISNRAATTSELADAFVFNDDNIIGEIGITATNLEDLYNLLEVEFASRKIRDQNDYYRGAIADSEMNDLEPANTLGFRLDLANNALHCARVGLIELKGSRVDLIITFRSDYSALQCEAGDVVKVTNDVYGFADKLFRISKIREVEDDSGSITCEITALEYSAGVYDDEILVDSPDTPGSGIPVFGGSATLPAPSTPTVTTISTTTPSFRLSTTIATGSSPVDEVQWWYNTTSTGSFTYLTNEYNSTGGFIAGDVVIDTVTIPASGTFYFRARTGASTQYSEFSPSTTTGFNWNPNDYGGI